MKKLLLSSIIALGCVATSYNADAQLQKGNIMVGGQLGNIGFGFGDASHFSIGLTPRVGYFIQNNVAIGGYADIGFTKYKDVDGIFNYGIGAFGRYYFAKGEVYNPLRDGRFFVEAQAGLSGMTNQEVGFRLAPAIGYAYFLTPNVALETMAQLNADIGNGTTVGLNIGVGFQIYLPTAKLRAELEKVKEDVE